MQGVVGPDSASTGITCCPTDIPDPYAKLLAEFLSVTLATFSDCPVKHCVVYHIQTTGPATVGHTRHLAPERLWIAKHEFDQMLQMGIVRPSAST